MNNLKDKIINFLTNGYGFVMESYQNSYNGYVSWVAIKAVENGDYAVIITDEVNDVRDTSDAINYLNSRGRRYGFHKIIISNRGYVNNDSYSKVVIDNINNSVIYVDNDAEVLAKVARNVMNNSSRRNVNKPSVGSIFNNKGNYITLGLIGINLVMYLISAIMSRNFINIDTNTLAKLGGNITGYAMNYFGGYEVVHEYWRFFTCMFLHGGIMHLAFNMYALYCIGPQVERFLGRVKYLIIYFVSGLSASIFSYLFAYINKSYITVSIGASGAIFGLFGALLAFTFFNRDRIQKGFLSYLIFIIGLNLFIGFNSSNIDNLAHIGGLVLGSIIGLVFVKIDSKNYTRR